MNSAEKPWDWCFLWKEPIEFQWCVIFVNQSRREIINKINCQKVPKNIVHDEHQPNLSVKIMRDWVTQPLTLSGRKVTMGKFCPAEKKASLSLLLLWFLTLRKHQKYLVGYLKPRLREPTSWVSDSVQLEWGPRICNSKNIPGTVDSSWPRITLSLLRTTALYNVSLKTKWNSAQQGTPSCASPPYLPGCRLFKVTNIIRNLEIQARRQSNV